MKYRGKLALVGVMFASIGAAGAADVPTIATKGYVDGGLATKADIGSVNGLADTVSNNTAAIGAVEGAVTTLGNTVAGHTTEIAGKQNQIGDGTAGTVITNTGTAGTVGSVAVDATATEGSPNLITSGAVAAAVSTAVNGVVDGLVQVDWTETEATSSAYIKNKPNLENYATAAQGTLAENALQRSEVQSVDRTVMVGDTENGFTWANLTPDIYPAADLETPIP